MTTTDLPPVHLPPGPRSPKVLQGLGLLSDRESAMRAFFERFGPTFTLRLPVVGNAVVTSEPDLIRELFSSNPDDVGRRGASRLGQFFGPGSFFSIAGEEHRRQRKLLTPPFHGRRMKAYEQIIEEETRREAESWPIGTEFRSVESMMRITLNAILRAVFGANGADLDELRRIVPELISIGSQGVLPYAPRFTSSRVKRFVSLRAEYDRQINIVLDETENDPAIDSRDDVAALMLQARYDDGTPMARQDIADQLLTLLAAGHETTATTLAWAMERLRRHPEVLERLAAEVSAGESSYRAATIMEVQRTRPVVEGTGRIVLADRYQLGEWTIPKGYVVLVSILLLHENPNVYADPLTFSPERFLGVTPDASTWIPFGGGIRRCIGAAFASMEMDIVLRTLLTDFTIIPTSAPDEGWQSRGVTTAPDKGGLLALSPSPG